MTNVVKTKDTTSGTAGRASQSPRCSVMLLANVAGVSRGNTGCVASIDKPQLNTAHAAQHSLYSRDRLEDRQTDRQIDQWMYLCGACRCLRQLQSGPQAIIGHYIHTSSLVVPAAYNVMTTPLTTHVIQMCQLSYCLPKNWVVRSPPYFAQGILGMTPKTLKIS